MNLILQTGPASEPITLAQAKTFLRIDTGAEDSLLQDVLIPQARQYAENWMRRALLEQTWDLFLDAVGDGALSSKIELPRPPLFVPESGTGVSVTWFDEDGTATAVDAGDYVVIADGEPGLVVLKSGESWPTDAVRDYRSYRIRFTAGYASAAAIPRPIIGGVHRVLASLYDHREDLVIGTIVAELPLDAQALLAPYRVILL